MLSKDTHRFILYIRDRIEQGKPVFRGRTGSGTVHAGTKDQTGTGVYTIMYKKCSLRGIMKKKILLCLIAQLICWGIMTMSDYMEETYNDSFNLIVVFAVPLMCVVLYIIFRRWIYDNQMVRLKDVAIICETWLICGLILGFLIGALVNNQMWIVSQATGGWEYLLNGIEYMMFAVTLAGIPFVAVVLIESVIGIVKLLRKTRRNKIMIKILFICHGTPVLL